MKNIDFNIDSFIAKAGQIDNIVLDEAVDKACLIVENAAKKNVPVDTGALRRSITHEVENGTGYIGTNLEYAPYVEYGTGIFAAAGDGRKERWSYQTADGQWHSTVGQHPQPFLHPALDNNRKKVMDAIKRYYIKKLKEIAKNA